MINRFRLVIAVLVTACAGRPDDLSWDFSEWQPIHAPCPTCRQGRVLQAAPVIPIKLPKSTKTGAVKASLVPLPQSSPAPTFPPARTSPAPTSKQQGGRVQLVYLPEGSIQQLSSANAARIIPTSRAPQRVESLDVVPPPPAPQAIQSIEFSDKQKRDHEGRIVQGGVNNALPMSLVTAQGKEGDALEKLRLLETALSTSSQEATVNQQDGRLPRVFIAPSHVPPPPGYVKIPLVPQGGSGAQDPRGAAPLPPTFLTPDNRSPPPGFVKFDLPPGVNQLSQDIPVVVPNSQIGPSFQPGRPALSPFPGLTRPDASINFQAQDERDAKSLGTPQSKPSIQTIPQGEAKPISPTTTPRPSPLPTTRPPVQARPTASQPQPFPPRQPFPFPQQFPQNPNQPRPFNSIPGQPPFTGFAAQQFPQTSQLFPQPGQPFIQPGQPVPRPGQFPPRPNQPFPQAGQPFPQAGQPFRQPIQPFPQAGQPFPRPGQPFPQPGQPFPQPGQPVIQPGQPILPPRPNQNQTIFREQPIRPDFPTINGFQPNFPAIFPPNPFQPRIPQQPSPRPPTLPSPQPSPRPAQITPRPPVLPERPSPSPFPTTTTAAPTTFRQTTPNSVLGTTPRPQLVSQTSSRPFPDPFRSPRPTPSPSPRPTPRPVVTTPRPTLITSPTTPSRPSEITPAPQLTPRPLPSTFDSSPRPFDSSPRPFDSSPRIPLFQGTSTPNFPSFQATGAPQIPSFQATGAPQIPSFQATGAPQNPSFQTTGATQLPSFQTTDAPRITPFEGTPAPRIPSFQGTTTPEIPAFQTTGAPQRITVQERPRRPKFPSFQRPRITTASPEEDLTTIPDENDFLTPAPTTFTTPTPPTSTTIKVTTFKPRFNFNVGSRRPFIRRKPRPTPVNDGKKDNEEKKVDGLKKTESATLFPPFSVARTLNPLRKEEENAGDSSSASQGITVPPAGVFGRRLRPRTRKPSTQSEGDSDSPVSTPALRNRDTPSARTRQLPAWLKSRRRLRGRFRSTTTTTEPSAQDIDYIDDTPVDILDNNGFNGAESTLVVFSRPPQNEVGEHFIPEDAVKTLAEEAEALKNEEVEEALIAAEEAVLSYAEEVDAESNREDAIHSLEENAKITETDGEEPLPEPEAEPHEPQASYEDYSAETTDVAPEPEPEPEHQTEYVTEYNEYKDDKEDNLETLHTPDQSNRNPPSLPHTQPDSHASTHSPAHAQPAGGFYQNTSVENPTINLVVEHPVEHIVDEVVEAVDDALEDNDNPIALLTDTPFDDVTEVPVQYDTEPSLEYDYESVTDQASSSHEFNETEVVDETFHVAGQEEGEKEGGELESEEEEDELESEEEENELEGESQNYDYYEYDHYADADYTEGVDQRFSGSNAHVIFAVPVTEYIPEDTTQINLDEEATEEVIDQATEFFPTTDNFAEEADTEVTTEYTAPTEDDSMMKETMGESQLERSESTTPLVDEYTTLNPFESDSDAITTVPTTELGTIDLGITTTARPASLRPLHTRLQEVGKKAVRPIDKKDSRSPKILSESTIREVHASDPVVCFRDNRCFRTRGLRRRRAARRSASGPALPLNP
ncbi:mucin-2-like [Penaeus indicus]|uniref:mucin-2-like n=1 Tax=Penaeus indicus TaxID=29960 RepID=UPI00300C420B